MTRDDPIRQRARRAMDALRALILEGRWVDGRLPAAWELERDLGVGRNALRAALAQLAEEGLVTRARGVGIVSAPTRVDYAAARLTTLDEHATQPTRHTLLTWRGEPAPPLLAEQLGVAVGATAVLYERLTSDSAPLAFWSTRLRADAMPQPCAVGDSTTHGYYAQLELAGQRIGKASLRTTALAAPPAIAELLEVREGAALLVQHRMLFDREDRVLDVSAGYFRPDRVVLSERVGRHEL